MQTKRYNIIFAGLDQELFSENRLSEIWEKEADAVYLESGIYISARPDARDCWRSFGKKR